MSHPLAVHVLSLMALSVAWYPVLGHGRQLWLWPQVWWGAGAALIALRPHWSLLLLGPLSTGAVHFALGRWVRRLSATGRTIITLGLGVGLFTLAHAWSPIIGGVFGRSFAPARTDLLWAAITLLVAFTGSLFLTTGRRGLVIRAYGEAPQWATRLRVTPTSWLSLADFWAGALGAAAGMVAFLGRGYADPSVFGLETGLLVVIASLGARNVWHTAAISGLLALLPELLRWLPLGFDGGAIRLGLYGLALLWFGARAFTSPAA